MTHIGTWMACMSRVEVKWCGPGSPQGARLLYLASMSTLSPTPPPSPFRCSLISVDRYFILWNGPVKENRWTTSVFRKKQRRAIHVFILFTSKAPQDCKIKQKWTSAKSSIVRRKNWKSKESNNSSSLVHLKIDTLTYWCQLRIFIVLSHILSKILLDMLQKQENWEDCSSKSF